MNRLGEYLAARTATEQAAGRTWFSEPEIRLCEELTHRGFPFRQQVHVSRRKTHVVLDFLVAGVLAVEVDGKAFHNPVADSARDYDVCVEHGLWTLRVPGWKVMRDAEAVVCTIALQLAKLHAPVERSVHNKNPLSDEEAA